MDEEATYRLAAGPVEVDGRAPGGVMACGEELGGIEVQEVALGAEVVVDDVQQDHQALAVGRPDQVLEVFRAAVAAVGSEGQHPVVAPIAGAVEVGDGHELDGGDAQLDQVVQALGDGGKAALRREGADVQFVDDRLFPRSSPPLGIGPAPTPRVDDLAGTEHVLGLETGGGIGHPWPTVDAITITAAGRGPVGHQAEPAVRLAAQGQDGLTGVRFEAEIDPRSPGGPEAEMHPPVGADLGAEGPSTDALNYGQHRTRRILREDSAANQRQGRRKSIRNGG